MSTNGSAIEIENLTKVYGRLVAVDDVSFSVPSGSVFGLIGPNGAGKSTTFSVLATLLSPDGGRVRVAGFDPSDEPLEVRRRMGYMPDVMGVYDDLRVDEYLGFFAAAYGVASQSRRGLVDGLLDLVDLDVKREAMVDSLSRGMKQRLSLARALVHDPEILILDEPASGLDPRARIELRHLLQELRDMGKTIVISSHILAELEEMCTEVAILEAGKLVAAGSPRDIRDRLGAGRRIEVRLADGDVLNFTVADSGEQQELLHRLVVEEGRAVVEFVEKGSGLEELFMELTEGKVQ